MPFSYLDLTDEQWVIFQDTIRLAANTTDPESPVGRSIWEHAAVMHTQLQAGIHWSANFLFFHRMFVTMVERKLQKLNPKFAFPYWDSSAAWDRARDAPVLAKVDPAHLFDGKVFECAKSPVYRTFESQSTLPTTEFYGELYTNSLQAGGFEEWSRQIEIAHGSLHNEVGGIMATMASPLDPLFYLHHADIDFLWVQAQAGWASTPSIGFGGQFGGFLPDGSRSGAESKIPGYGTTFASVVDISSMCVEYALPGHRMAADVTISLADLPHSLTIEATSKPTVTTTSMPHETATVMANGNVTNIFDLRAPMATAISSGVIPTTTATSSALPRQTQEPTTRAPLSRCPKPLPEKWIAMQEKGSAVKGIRDEMSKMNQLCETIVENVENGCEAPAMPLYEPHARPFATEHGDAPKAANVESYTNILSSAISFRHSIFLLLLPLVY